MTRRQLHVRRLARAATLAAVLAAAPGIVAGLPASAGVRDDQQTANQPQKRAKKDPMVKLNEPWPDAAKKEQERANAEHLALFASAEPLPLTITADLSAINKVRVPESPLRFPGTVELAGEGGNRRRSGGTGFARPPPAERADVFDGPVAGRIRQEGREGLRLRRPRRPEAGYTLPERQRIRAERPGRYLAYRIYNLFTPLPTAPGSSGRPMSIRRRAGRLPRATGSSSKTTPTWRAGTEDGLSARQPGVQAPRPGLARGHVADAVHARQHRLLDRLSAQHQADSAPGRPVPADHVRLRPVGPGERALRPTGERTRDPDRPRPVLSRAVPSVEQLEPWLARFRAKQGEAMALVNAIPGFEAARRQDVTDFLGDFFSILNSAGRTKRLLVDRCPRVAGM